MRTRTRLTTPPGQEPTLAAETRSEEETYVPGLALPDEARVPGRFRRVWITLAVIAVVVLVGWAVVEAITAGESFDPALAPRPGAPTDPSTADPTLPGEG